MHIFWSLALVCFIMWYEIYLGTIMQVSEKPKTIKKLIKKIKFG